MSETNQGQVDAVANALEQAIGHAPESVTVDGTTTVPTPKRRPTAQESLAKQRAADAVKKVTKGATAKKSTPKPKKEKKTPSKKPATESKKTGLRKDPSELRMMQIRALKVLDGKTEPTDGLTMEQLAKAAKISPQVMKRGIGAVKSENRIAHDAANGFKSLLSRGMVKIAFDEEKGTVYYLGTLGDKAIEKNAETIKSPPKVHAKPFSVNGEKKSIKKKAPAASK